MRNLLHTVFSFPLTNISLSWVKWKPRTEPEVGHQDLALLSSAENIMVATASVLHLPKTGITQAGRWHGKRPGFFTLWDSWEMHRNTKIPSQFLFSPHSKHEHLDTEVNSWSTWWSFHSLQLPGRRLEPAGVRFCSQGTTG